MGNRKSKKKTRVIILHITKNNLLLEQKPKRINESSEQD